MQYAQLNQDGTYLQELPNGNYQFADNVFQPASTLTDAQKAEFRIVTLLPIGEPAFDPLTQSCTRNGGELVNGQWQYAYVITALDEVTKANNLARAQADKTVQIKAERDRRKFNGVYVANKWIHTDTFSRTQWIGMLMAGGALPAIQWATIDGSYITTTPTLAGQVFQAIMTQDATLFALATAKIAAMMALADPTAYDPLTGWPATFGE